MKSKAVSVSVSCLLGSALAFSQAVIAQQRGGPQQAAAQPQEAQEKLPRNVTVTAIPGVIAAGAKWQQVWQGADNADGIIGTPDGGVLFAQEQPNTIRKLDVKDFDSAYAKDTHGAGSIAMDSQGRIIAVQRTCTDPGRGDAPCSEPTKVAVIYPENERKVLADNFQGKPLGRLNDLVVDKKGDGVFHFRHGLLRQAGRPGYEPWRQYPFQWDHAQSG